MSVIEYQYINIVMYNTTATDSLLSYTDTRPQSVVEKASEWELSVVRFSIPTSRMPLFVFINNLWGIGDETGSPYIFQTSDYLTYANTNSNNYPAGDIRQLYVYSSAFWIDFINKMINLHVDSSANAPILIFDETLNKLRWVAPATSTYVAAFGVSPTNYLTFTPSLYNTFFSGFEAFYDNIANLYRIWIISTPTSGVAADTYAAPINVASQALDDECFSTLTSWNTIRRLVLTSSQLQVNTESVAIYNNSQAQNVGILTDYEIPYAPGLPSQRAYAFYQPNIFRYSSLITDQQIKKLDLTVYFENSTNQTLYPLYFAPATDAYIKILLRRKLGNRLEVDRRDGLLNLIAEEDREKPQGKGSYHSIRRLGR